MRLAQKGYTVGVVEAGKRWHADEFPRRNWNLRKFLWLPSLGLYGTWRLRLLNGAFILAGSGVGGGSLNYANTLYVPPDVFFERPSVRRLGGKDELLPYYDLAGRMLGVARNPVETPQDVLMKETAAEIGREATYRLTNVAVYFGKEGEPAADPYFEGEGPDRVGCELCGECMTGCRKDAKNSLDKNYLYFAEKFGARIFAENRVVDIEPLGPEGSEGYRVRTRKTTGPLARPARPDLPDQGAGPRRGRPGHELPASRHEAQGPAAQPVRASRPLRPDEQRDPARRALARGRRRLHPRRRHHLERPSRRGHAPRTGPLRQGPRRHVRPRRGPDGRREEDAAVPPLDRERAAPSRPQPAPPQAVRAGPKRRSSFSSCRRSTTIST